MYCIPDDEYASFWNGTIESTGINEIGDFTNQTDIQALYSQAPVLDKKWKELGDRCLSGPNATTLGYIGTAATVRDLVGLADAIVGQNSTINYWGLSYGTLVGAWFINSGSLVSSLLRGARANLTLAQCSRIASAVLSLTASSMPPGSPPPSRTRHVSSERGRTECIYANSFF